MKIEAEKNPHYMKHNVVLLTLLAGMCLLISLPSCKKKKMKECQTIIDARDNHSYKTTFIGNQCWMAENLRFYDNALNQECYEYKQVNCDTCGSMYYSVPAINPCPEGWHLPTKEEFDKLIDYLGGESEALDKMKVGGSSGFELIKCGILSGIWFQQIHKKTSLITDKAALYFQFVENKITQEISPNWAGYCRCVKDD